MHKALHGGKSPAASHNAHQVGHSSSAGADRAVHARQVGVLGQAFADVHPVDAGEHARERGFRRSDCRRWPRPAAAVRRW